MPVYGQDMGKVEKWGETVPEGWYHVRVEKGEERMSEASGEPMWCLWLKVQNEPFTGRVIFDMPSLQPHALAKLKAYYDAAGYVPDASGHDPDNLTGKEFYVLVQHETYQGQTRGKVPPYGIKSMQEGPAGALAA
jgi:hypothetical protein